MTQALRLYDRDERVIHLSEALDHCNQVFQLAHVLCLVEFQGLLNELTAASGIAKKTSLARCHVELANYFAAAFLMPYETFLRTAESTAYDIDRIAARFAVSFEQACHRLTTMQRPGAQGVPFFFLRVDKAGNVTKRFNSTSFHLAEYGGSCPVWNIHMAFRTPGVILPQFVELAGRRPLLHDQPHRRSSCRQSGDPGSPSVGGAWLRASICQQASLCGFIQRQRPAAVQQDRHQLPPVSAPGVFAAGAPAGVHGIAARHGAARQHPIRKLSSTVRASRRRASLRSVGRGAASAVVCPKVSPYS